MDSGFAASRRPGKTAIRYELSEMAAFVAAVRRDRYLAVA
jgi:hypothetical protein